MWTFHAIFGQKPKRFDENSCKIILKNVIFSCMFLVELGCLENIFWNFNL